MLEELIAYLRAAIPRMRDSSSSLEQELALVRAYLRIVAMRPGSGLAFELEAPKQLGDMRMPPMMLLPLIDHALVHGGPMERGRMLHVTCQVVEERLQLVVQDSAEGFLPGVSDHGIAAIRERLAALYGSRAALVLRGMDAGPTEAYVEVPCETASASRGPGGGSTG
jgi:LytS/YehU family sensor histidine kinase